MTRSYTFTNKFISRGSTVTVIASSEEEAKEKVNHIVHTKAFWELVDPEDEYLGVSEHDGVEEMAYDEN